MRVLWTILPLRTLLNRFPGLEMIPNTDDVGDPIDFDEDIEEYRQELTERLEVMHFYGRIRPYLAA
jgi:hypothetical protein